MVILLSLFIEKFNSKVSFFIDDKFLIYKLIFYNYSNLYDFSEDVINIDKMLIIGNDLLITKLEDNVIEINGKIKEIKKYD